MIKLKELLKEWTDTSFKDLPKRWSKPVMKGREPNGLTEFERLGGKDSVFVNEIKVGDTYISSDGKYIELVFDKFMKGKWRTIGFDLGPKHFVRDIGTSPEHLLGMYGKLKKLSSSQKNSIKKILKNPEDVHMVKRDGQNINRILRSIK